MLLFGPKVKMSLELLDPLTLLRRDGENAERPPDQVLAGEVGGKNT